MRCFLPMLIALSCFGCAHAQGDLRITLRREWQPGTTRQESERSTTVLYRKGDRIRIENDIPKIGRVVSIQQCDSQKFLSIMPDKREYTEVPMQPVSPPNRDADTAKQQEGEPNLIFEVTTVDTGETKQAFGHTARHYITTTKITPAPELGQDASEGVEDAWYLDMPDVSTCTPVSRHHRGGFLMAGASGRRLEPGERFSTFPTIRPKFVSSGPDPQGLQLSARTTHRSEHVLQTGEKQKYESVSLVEVVNIEQVSLDPALFDAPAGYTKVTTLEMRKRH